MTSIDPKTLIAERDAKTVIVDVREPDEFAAGHVQGAVNIPLSELMARHTEIPDGAYIICRSGNRSAMATEFLNSKGHEVVNVLGGVNEWPESMVL